VNRRVAVLLLLSGLSMSEASCFLLPPAATSARSTARAKKKEKPAIPGTYSGTFGDSALVLNLLADGSAEVDMDGAVVETRYRVIGADRFGDRVISVRFSPRVTLCFIRSGDVHVASGCRRPYKVLRAKTGKLMSALKFKGRPPVKPSVKLADTCIRWDMSSDVHDMLQLLGEGFTGRPQCPDGAQEIRQEKEVEGVPVVVFTCEGDTGPFLMASARSFDTQDPHLGRAHRVLWLGQMEGGLKTGRWVFRGQDGRKMMDGHYDRGKEHGLWFYWRPGGEFQRQVVYHNGQKIWQGVVGERNARLPAPVEAGEFVCSDGDLVVEDKIDSVNFKGCSKLNWEEYVEDSVWRGPAVGWTDNGQLLFHAYESGDGGSVVAIWYGSGQIRSKAGFKNGQASGPVYSWHRNGLLATEKHIREGKRHGRLREWNEAGKVVRYGNYLDGEKNGEWSWVSDQVKGVVTQDWAGGTCLYTKASSIYGNARISSEFIEEGYEIHKMLTPVHSAIFTVVTWEALRKNGVPRRTSKRNHEASIAVACRKIAPILRTVRGEAPSEEIARRVVKAGVEVFCSRTFDPDRDPKMPNNPFEVECRMTNGRKSGPCVEVTVEDCTKTVTRACDL
jgi:antitoxin component YwqK of YwqJK toxin-antitoxin module